MSTVICTCKDLLYFILLVSGRCGKVGSIVFPSGGHDAYALRMYSGCTSYCIRQIIAEINSSVYLSLALQYPVRSTWALLDNGIDAVGDNPYTPYVHDPRQPPPFLAPTISFVYPDYREGSLGSTLGVPRIVDDLRRG